MEAVLSDAAHEDRGLQPQRELRKQGETHHSISGEWDVQRLPRSVCLLLCLRLLFGALLSVAFIGCSLLAP